MNVIVHRIRGLMVHAGALACTTAYITLTLEFGSSMPDRQVIASVLIDAVMVAVFAIYLWSIRVGSSVNRGSAMSASQLIPRGKS